MDSRLSTLISDYQAAVRQAVELMAASGIERPASSTQWGDLDIRQSGELNGQIRYYKHGYGCAVHLPRGLIDFDFGSNGEIDGFDAWRLIGFAGARLCEYGFSSEADLKKVFDAAAQSDDIWFSGYLLYYLAGSNG
ncbi:DUF6896 domain-containing protein [Massilia sp. TWP1-3-3]|uniref:DUF6896 domain-containing protein n=1 Tax=Massilia sp. TWP1-3-3 TaxID=2804573 RepID=UPI003CE67A6A